MPDQWNISFLHIHNYSWRMWRNGHRDLDRYRCLRKSAGSRFKDHHRQLGSIADHDGTCQYHRGLRWITCCKYNTLY